MAAAFERILQFWFAPPLPNDKLWFGKDETIDRRVREEFGLLFDDPQVESWASDPPGRLAAILLYDQFSRNAFRDTARSFAYDSKALHLAHGARLENYSFYETLFLLLPFEHSENLTDQDQSVVHLQELLKKASTAEETKAATSWLDFAERHRAIIRRFGRFPHRNQILARVSTPEEVEFLKQPGSRF